MSQPPSDAISAVIFAPDNTNRLLVSSWDRNVYLYEIAEGTEDATLINKFEHRAPVLDVCFGANGNEAYTASLDCSVKRFVALIAYYLWMLSIMPQIFVDANANQTESTYPQESRPC